MRGERAGRGRIWNAEMTEPDPGHWPGVCHEVWIYGSTIAIDHK